MGLESRKPLANDETSKRLQSVITLVEGLRSEVWERTKPKVSRILELLRKLQWDVLRSTDLEVGLNIEFEMEGPSAAVRAMKSRLEKTARLLQPLSFDNETW